MSSEFLNANGAPVGEARRAAEADRVEDGSNILAKKYNATPAPEQSNSHTNGGSPPTNDDGQKAEPPHPAVTFLQGFYGEGKTWQLSAIGEQGLYAIPLSPKLYPDPAKRAEAAAKWIDRHNADGMDIYFSPNPLSHALSTKASKEDVAGAEWLFVEFDPPADATVDRPDYANPTPENKEAWRQQVQKVAEWRGEMRALFAQWSQDGLPGGLPKPSLVIDSGRGFWFYWRLSELISFMGEDRVEAIARVEACARGIIQVFEDAGINAKVDAAVKNVDRIARLPGTRNWRTLWTAKVLAFHPHAYALSDFPAVIIERQEQEAAAEVLHQEQHRDSAGGRGERTSTHGAYSRDGRRPPSMERMRAILQFLAEQDYFKDYHVWVETGMALKLAYLDDGGELWALTHWPPCCGKNKNSPEELDAKWRSFAMEPGPNQKTIGSIIWAAKNRGFKFGPDLTGWAENVGGEGEWSFFADEDDDYPKGESSDGGRQKPKRPPVSFAPYVWRDPSTLPRRPFIYGRRRKSLKLY